MKITPFFDKTGSVGAFVATLGCAGCFPALASVGAALGLGFLARFEGLFINTLLPIFAVIALIANLYTGILYRQWLWLLVGIIGPLMILATLYLFWTDNWSTYLFYFGLGLMLLVSLWDLISPAHKVCNTPVLQANKET